MASISRHTHDTNRPGRSVADIGAGQAEKVATPLNVASRKTELRSGKARAGSLSPHHRREIACATTNAH